MGSPSRNVQYHPPRLSEDRLNLAQPHSPSLPTHCSGKSGMRPVHLHQVPVSVVHVLLQTRAGSLVGERSQLTALLIIGPASGPDPWIIVGNLAGTLLGERIGLNDVRVVLPVLVPGSVATDNDVLHPCSPRNSCGLACQMRPRPRVHTEPRSRPRPKVYPNPLLAERRLLQWTAWGRPGGGPAGPFGQHPGPGRPGPSLSAETSRVARLDAPPAAPVEPAVCAVVGRKTHHQLFKLEISYLTLYNGECEETRWSLA